MNRLSILFFFLLLAGRPVAFSQELQVKVTLNAGQIKSSAGSIDPTQFKMIEQAIQNFMNTHKWTNDSYQQNEKIKCNLIINLTEAGGNFSYAGNAQFRVFRPVYGTNYETPILEVFDKNFTFSFGPQERQMIFNEVTFSSDLTSLLAYYSLLAVGMDRDSYSLYGGDEFINRAYSVGQVAGQVAAKNNKEGDWSLSNDNFRSRIQYAVNFQDQLFIGYRKEFYEYHRMGLDQLTTQRGAAPEKTMSFLTTLENITHQVPQSVAISSLFNIKYQEFVNVLSESDLIVRKEAYDILSVLDPEHTSAYHALISKNK